MSFGGGGDTRVGNQSQRACLRTSGVASQRYGQMVIACSQQFMAQTRDFLDNDQNTGTVMGEASTRALGIYEQGFDFNRAAFNKGYDPGSGSLSGAVQSYPNAPWKEVWGEQWVMPECLQQTKAARMMGTVMEGVGLQSDTPSRQRSSGSKSDAHAGF